jgi:hypothetical protein
MNVRPLSWAPAHSREADEKGTRNDDGREATCCKWASNTRLRPLPAISRLSGPFASRQNSPPVPAGEGASAPPSQCRQVTRLG